MVHNSYSNVEVSRGEEKSGPQSEGLLCQCLTMRYTSEAGK